MEQKKKLTRKDVLELINNRTDLSSANLSGVDISCINLSGVDLSCINLSGADLSSANLSGANLRCANLSSANLRCANLSSANLSCINLSSANLYGANLYGANLSGADLRCANLSSANLKDVLTSPCTTGYSMVCPEEGSFIGWKSLRCGYIAKLRILEDSKRSSATTRKCRASKVEVLDIYNSEGELMHDDFEGVSIYDVDFIYKKGTVIEVADFDDNRWNECTKGVHFFITRAEAENYNK